LTILKKKTKNQKPFAGGFVESASSRGGLLLQGRVFICLEFYGVHLPLSLVDMLHATSGGFGT
jgi:hypothetical protein